MPKPSKQQFLESPRANFAIGLHMHQPPDNLKLLIEHNEWEAQQIIRCYERAVRFAHLLKDVAYFQVGFSGILLEQFQDRYIIDRYRNFVDIPQMLENYRRAKNIEIIGMGYYHPIFPLIPKEDWNEQLSLGRKIVEEIFGQSPKGFWPSEMAFCMDMVPALKKAGYEYAVVDHVHVHSESQGQPLDFFQPYSASFGGATITIIPRNRDISNAQESGLNPSWFLNEFKKKIAESPDPKADRLLTTWSDGENGGWFRQMDDNAGFWGYFFAPLMGMVKEGTADAYPTKISDYLKTHAPQGQANVHTGAWNVGSTSGYDFAQWNGSQSQKRAIDELFKVSKRYWEIKNSGKAAAQSRQLAEARQFILDAETSCYLFWGESWLPKIYDKINAAKAILK
jgi:4-alpha-glucanotransferase